MENQLLLSPADAALVMSISRSLLYELLESGDISSIKVRRARRIPVESVKEYIAARQREAQGAGNQQETTTSPEQNGGAK